MKSEQLEKVLSTAQSHGLGITSLQALLRLNKAVTAGDFGVKLTELAELCGVSAAAITGMSDRLEKAGYATREKSKSDRRVIKLLITPKGQELLNIILNS